MERQPLEVQTLYAELMEQLAAQEASRSMGHTPGTFVTKTVKGQEYYYFQHLDPGGVKRQTYIGRRDEALDSAVRRFAEGRQDSSAGRESIERLAALLRAGGAMTTDVPSARVVGALADAGVFHLGGVLIGTLAFIAIGNMLGYRWGSALRTQDIDIAAEQAIDVAVAETQADLPSVLDNLQMGFLPVPGLDPRSPSTSFKVRGHGLRVDLLTPADHRRTRPVAVSHLAAAAQPLRFLDYLMESPVKAAVLSGTAVLVNVPDPARFALHKLIVAEERPATMQVKREKDLRQSGQLLNALFEDRPGDVSIAWDALEARGKAWMRRVTQSLGALERVSPSAAAGLTAFI